MSEHPISIIGNLLQLPHLEEQTVKDVNQALRSMIAPFILTKPPDDQGSIDPFTPNQQAIDAMFGPGVFEEWTEGKVSKDG